MPSDFVFVGPSLPRAQVKALLPGASILPPVRHGDLLRLSPRAGDRVLIIDGLFLQSAPVRHKEILALLVAGVTVVGSSSMGALRAAELHAYGMRGVGEVFEMYRSGAIDGDDEVAVIHTSGDDGYRALSEPLVSLRVAIGEAARHGAITSDAGAALLRIARGLPFRLRSQRMLVKSARQELPGGVVGQFDAWYREHARDLKASDAIAMLTQAASGDPALCPHGPRDRPITNPVTTYVAHWTDHFRGQRVGETWVSDSDITSAIMLLHPGFPQLHRRSVLSGLVGLPPDAPDLEAAAVADAARHALDWQALRELGVWLTPREARELADSAFVDEAIIRVLVRAFGTVSPAAKARGCVSRVADDGTRAWARQVAAEAIRVNQLLPRTTRPGRPDRFHYRDEVVDQVYARQWGVDVEHLLGAVWDRGFDSLETFRQIAEPFVMRLKVGPALDALPASTAAA
ncbi:MAG: hypothetical protein JWM19_3892 [Actinomycetia bacterium]|nr:hypothetical protein [Actinomycetes bacterium]